MDAKNIGQFLFKLRKEKNLTQKEISKLCNVSTQAVSKWERGDSVPDIEILDRLSKLYSLTINEIINGERNEIFVDKTKKINVVMLTISILVFIAYAFNYISVEFDSSFIGATNNGVLKGYQLILNGLNGWYVYLTWFVFLMLTSHLVINIFALTKVIERSKNIYLYQLFSLLLIISISFASILEVNHYAFPQFIILLCSSINLLLLLSDTSEVPILFELRKYSKLKKTKEVPDAYILENNKSNKIAVLLSKITITFVSLFFGLLSISFFIAMIDAAMKPNTDLVVAPIEIYFLSLWIIIAVTLAISIKYIGSKFTKTILRFDGLLILVLFASFILFLSRFIIALILLIPIIILFISYNKITSNNSTSVIS